MTTERQVREGSPSGAARRVLVTGATSGIGLATARHLAPSVDLLVLHGPEPADHVAATIDDVAARGSANVSVAYFSADYGRLSDVTRLARDVIESAEDVDLLVNNAAIPGPAIRAESDDGHELTWQVNYLAPVALTSLLVAARRTSTRPLRVVNVASATHLTARLALEDPELRQDYSPIAAYARSKLALVTYGCWLARHADAARAEAVSMHPGVISTALLHSMFGAGGDPPEAGARAIVEVAGRSGDAGAYYDETRRAEPHPAAHDIRVQRRLLALTTQQLVGIPIVVGEGADPS